jgi:mRNA-degrading endonuclease YafQ of YafQ-DinJ toxin-antitoxin module
MQNSIKRIVKNKDKDKNYNHLITALLKRNKLTKKYNKKE